MAKKKKKKTTRKKKAGRRTTANRTAASKKKSSRKKAPRRTGRLAGVSTDALQAEIKRRLEELETHRTELEAEIVAIDAEVGRLGGIVRGRRAPGTGKRPHNKENLVQALHKLLKKKTLSVTEAAAAVQRAGYRTTSENFRVIVNQTLINNSDKFRKVSRGMYTSR